MAEDSTPESVVLGLVRVVNGELPRAMAERYLHPEVKIHMDSANHRGIRMWYKWIHLIRNRGRLRDLRMTHTHTALDPADPRMVVLSMSWSGVPQGEKNAVVAPQTARLKYLVEDGRVTEIWTRKSNYVPIFGSSIRNSLCYRSLLARAIIYFFILSLRGRDFRDDPGGVEATKGEPGLEKNYCTWQNLARTKYTFIFFHLLCLSYFVAGRVTITGSLAVWFAMQMGIHAGYHRYFSHASFRTSPWFEFILGITGCLAFQNGPLWWASKHRFHHRTADTGEDLHSPTKGFWHSHVGWLWLKEADEIDWQVIPDLRRPVPLWIQRFQGSIHLSYIAIVYLLAGWNGLLAFWVTPIVFCWHTTFATNSLCHMIGTHPFACRPEPFCQARNNFVVAILNLGEGWHSNHHANPSRSHHGFYRWYQLDIVYLFLLLLERVGIIWEVKRKPRSSRERLQPHDLHFRPET